MNVLIVGFGFVGLTLGASLSTKGCKVYGVDNNENIVNKVNNGKAHFYEPKINEILNKNINKTIFCFSNPQNLKGIKIDIAIISVGTPVDNLSKDIILGPLDRALKSILPFIDLDTLLILRSTVSVGTTRNIIAPIIKNHFKKNDEDILLGFCPERTVEGNALIELEELPQIISGINNVTIKKAKDFFSILTKENLVLESLEAAELVKLFNNTYRDIFFATGNLFNSISQIHGLDGLKLIKASNYNYSRSSIPLPGLVGGPCLVKDPYILSKTVNEDSNKFVIGAREYNQNMIYKLFEWVKTRVFENNISKITISGMAFKGSPETSDMRDSPSLILLELINDLNVNITLHDFCVSMDEMKILQKDSHNDFEKACENIDMLLILNNHPSYSRFGFELISKIMNKENKIIFDGWNMLDIKNLKDFDQYYTFGNFQIK